MKYRCLIVDDESLGRTLIKSYLESFEAFDVVEELSTGIEAIQFLAKHEVDLVFLDINLPNITGIELLKQSRSNFDTILCTAYSEYAVESYDLDVVDYLLKPISLGRFAKAINKFLEKNQPVGSPAIQAEIHKPIFVKSEYKLIKIEVDEIQYIEAMEKYVRIHTLENKVMTLMSMSQIFDLLPEKKFMRIHRSYIVSLNKIDSLEGNMVIIGKNQLPISKANRKDFKLKLDV